MPSNDPQETRAIPATGRDGYDRYVSPPEVSHRPSLFAVRPSGVERSRAARHPIGPLAPELWRGSLPTHSGSAGATGETGPRKLLHKACLIIRSSLLKCQFSALQCNFIAVQNQAGSARSRPITGTLPFPFQAFETPVHGPHLNAGARTAAPPKRRYRGQGQYGPYANGPKRPTRKRRCLTK